jgi:hypothetical protein
VLLAVAHLALWRVVAHYRQHPAAIAQEWYESMLLGVGALVLAVMPWPARRDAASDATAAGRPWAARAFWPAVAALVVVFRVVPLLGLIPEGMVFEEHEAGWAARRLLEGEMPRMILYAFTNLYLAFWLGLLGLGEAAMRVGATLLGVVGSLLFAAGVRRHFRPEVALLCAAAFIASTSIANASHVIEESHSTVLFLQCGLLYCLLSQRQGPTLGRSVAMGLFSGLGLIEYAAVKPGTLLVPALVFLAGLWRGWRGRGGSLAAVRLVAAAYLFSLVCFLVASPILFDYGQGGSALFEGRRETMVGSGWRRTLEQQWPGLDRSLGVHAHILLVSADGYASGAIHAPGTPLLDPVVGLLALVGLVALPLAAAARLVRRLRRGDGARRPQAGPGLRLGWLALWLGWAGGLMLYCSYWNQGHIMEARLLVTLPLFVLAMGEVLDGAASIAADRGFRRGFERCLWALAGLVLIWSIATRVLSFTQPSSRVAYRSKTVELCRELRTLGDGPYLLYWDWRDSVYLGDERVEEWALDPARRGYDSWACQPPPTLRPIADLLQLRSALETRAVEAAGVRWVILGTRIGNDAEMRSRRPMKTLQTRLDGYVAALGSTVDRAGCRFFASSTWFRYGVCPVASPDSVAAAASLAP